MADHFTEKVKTKALELGFTKVSIAEAVELTEESARLREWLQLGYHATMGWMERTVDRRSDPRLFFPEVKSVIVVALNYFQPHQRSEDPQIGKVSRYAWGDDYHDVLTDKLQQLLAWMEQENPEVRGKICVDAQPAMDKVWAVRAGLGWIGKHSNLITMDHGSWVFLGELMVNLPLESTSKPIPDHCGSCTACLDACPTEAIVQPYVVDARKCISFATIESKEDSLNLPTEGWIFGCDICQDVCPWSRFSRPTSESRFSPHEDFQAPDLALWQHLTPEDFARKFTGSPIKRAKYRGLQRNIAHVQSRLSETKPDAPQPVPGCVPETEK
ncbi:MAG: tRNA epoxyqueuosine(34) reductase QueG [Acidobacteria bacterium]|nr:tRNA epoxyqueuosine(34) reductase QueG [Acidobacteriota bacterium]